RRAGESIFPGPGTELKPGDKILLAGPTDTFESARRAIEGERARVKRLVIGGSSQMARRLCEALAGTPWHITVFDPDPKAAHAMADAFDHIDVEQADPTDRAVFDEAEIDKADAFVSLTESDEHNLLASSTAHSRGVPNTVAVVKSANFEHLGKALGITKVLVPRTVAAREIQELLNEENVSRIPGKFMEGISGWRIRLPESSPLAGVELTSAGLSGRFIVLARCRNNVWDFARSNEPLGAGDQLLVVGRSELEDEIPSTFLESGSPA
ncbi:MAG: NAD-binding protein, partial [Planctomycetota bacterium]|nr:NAD-binding protein [Planctomycetota bacterium]